jgi:hypothetical protein
MPRIIVTTDTDASRPGGGPVLLSESVRSVHLSTDHSAAQLIERLAWAIGDAEDAEGADGWDFQLASRSSRARKDRVESQREPEAPPSQEVRRAA